MKKSWMALVVAALLLAATGARARDLLPDFSLATPGGGTVRLGDYLGKKNIVINFWASWCDACKEEVPVLLKLKEQAGDGVVFLGINVGDSDRAVQRFTDRHRFNYQILLDRDKSVTRRYKVVGVPQTMVISRNGEIVYRDSKPPANLGALLNARH